MLPDLRLLLIATASTFLVAICAAFFVSVHVLPDPLNAVQAEHTAPINRVPRNWQDAARPTPDVSPIVVTPPKDVPLPLPKAETAAESPSAESAAPKEDAAPDSTGSIAAAPATAEEEEHLAPAPAPIAAPEPKPVAPHAAVPPAAKPATRPARKHRTVQRDFFTGAPSKPSANDPGSNYFMDFGSRPY